MWITLLRKLWPYACIAVGVGLVLYGAYSHGRKVERAEWEPRFALAEKQKDKAETIAATKDAFSRELTSLTDERYAETIFKLNARAVDAGRDIRALSLRIAALAASRSEMPGISGATAQADASAKIEDSANRAADRFTRIGAGCELDAAQLESLQGWLTEQRLLWSAKPALP